MNKFNKNQANNKIPLNWWVILLIVASIGILISAIIYAITPKTTQVPQPSFTKPKTEETPSSFENISYTGPQHSFDQEVVIYKVKEVSFSEGNIKQRLLETYDLEPYESVNEVWVGPEYSLHKPEGESEYNLSARSFVGSSTKIKSLAAINTAKNEVEKLFPDSKLSPIEDEIKYYQGQSHLNPTTKTNAEWVKIPFSYLVEDIYPVYYQKRTKPVLEVFVGPKYKIKKMSIFAPLLRFEEYTQKKSLSIDQAVDNININTETVIINALTSEHGPLDLNKIKSGELSEVNLEYRLDQATGLLYPFYKFKGELINQNGEKVFAQIITSAVKTNQED